jgi:ubiquinone/menaquinone biosynthesis C-methylase UbiE
MKNSSFIPALKWHWATPFYDSFIKLTMPERKVKSKVIELLEINSSEKVLDFGFGTGTSLVMIAKSYPQARLFGYDVDEKIMKIARKKFDNENVEVTVFSENLEVISGNSMDKILSTWVFHHLTYDEKLESMSHLYRMLKPGGTLVIADWGKPQNFIMSFLFLILQVVDNFKTYNDNRNGSIAKLLLRAGFVKHSNVPSQNTLFGTLSYWKVSKAED